MVDTNFWIDYFREDDQAIKVLSLLKTPQVSISIVTYLELARGEVLAGSKTFRKRLADAIEPYQLLEIPVSVAKYTVREAFRLGRGRTPADMNDLCIGATARALGRTVLTKNVRDFSAMAGVKVKDWSSI